MDEKQLKGVTIQKRHIIIVLLIFLIILIGSIVVAFNWSSWLGKKNEQKTQSEIDSSAHEFDIDPNAGAWNGQQPEENSGEEVGIQIPGYPSITIAKDTTEVEMALLNPEGNPCYFKFTIVLKDSGDTIYESEYVPPGQVITDVVLSKPLAEGEYDATIQISTIAFDQETSLNGANIETVLIVK